MQSCFENYITLGDIEPEVIPRSGLFVTDLPGISLNQFEALVKDGQADVNEFWSKLYKRGKETFFNEVTRRLNNSFNVEKIISSEMSGTFDKARTINDVIGEAGVNIEFVKSKYSLVEIQKVIIYSVGDITDAIIEIIDNESEAILKTIQINLVDGFNNIDVFEQFENENIRVIYDPTQVQSIETTDYVKKKIGCYSCSKGVEQINGGGLVVSYTTICSIEAFICSRIGLFKTAFWYWLGVELMKERMTSELTNCFTIDIEEANRLYDLYKTEFDNALTPVLQNLKIKDDHICFDCKGSVTVKRSIP